MSVTPNMNITLPTPEVTTGPEWANQIVDAFDNVDGHDHTAGKGLRIPVAGLNINADLEFNDNDAIELRSTRYTNHGSVLSTSSDKNCVYFVGGDLFINNNAGTSIQLTSGNSINLSTVGTIGGDYGQPGVTASATYSDTTKTFSWTQAPTQAAKMAVGDLIVYETTVSAAPITIKSSSGVTVSYDFWLPQSGPSGNQLWRQNSTSSGANFVTIQGTANQLTITHGASTITASLPSTLIAPGTLSTVGNFDVATNKLTVNASSGNTAIAGTLAVASDLAVATNKFTANATTGDVLVAGDLAVNGGDITTTSSLLNLATTNATSINLGLAATSITIGANNVGTLFLRNTAVNVTGSLDVNNKFNVASTTGNTVIQGTLSSYGDLSVGNPSRFAVTASSGNTSISGTLAVTSTATFSGDVNIAGNGRGIIPLGAIIPMTSGFTNAMAIPSSGTVSNGFIRCDGAAIPGGNTVQGTTPNLTGSIYLRGASTYGGTGGNNTTTLAEANLPAHTHVNTLTNNTVATSNHTHNYAHVHEWANTAVNTVVGVNYQNVRTNATADYNTTSTASQNNGIFYGYPDSQPTGVSNSNSTGFYLSQSGLNDWFTSGVASGINGTGGSALTAGPSATTTVTLTNASIGSGTAFSNEPNYINVIYLMRVN